MFLPKENRNFMLPCSMDRANHYLTYIWHEWEEIWEGCEIFILFLTCHGL